MSAPLVRRVDMLTGAKAPDKFFQALSEADESISLCLDADRLRDENRELSLRVAELELALHTVKAERDSARQERDTAKARAARTGW